MANAKSEFLREALRQQYTVAVHTKEANGQQSLVHVSYTRTWTISTFGFVNAGLTHSSIAWVPWKRVFYMEAGGKYCVDWSCVPRQRLHGGDLLEMIDAYKRLAPSARWFGSVSVGPAPQLSRPPEPVTPASRVNRRLPAGWRVISGGAR